MMLNLPNFLTIFRIICVPIIAVLIITAKGQGLLIFAFLLFIVASLTDYLDGLTARTLNQSTEFGKVLDPIADKLMTVILLCVLYGTKVGDNFKLMIGLPIVVIIFREIFISGLREHVSKRSEVLQVSWIAKIKTGLQLTAIGTWIFFLAYPEFSSFEYIGLVLIWVAAVLTLISGLDYFIKAKPFFRN